MTEQHPGIDPDEVDGETTPTDLDEVSARDPKPSDAVSASGEAAEEALEHYPSMTAGPGAALLASADRSIDSEELEEVLHHKSGGTDDNGGGVEEVLAKYPTMTAGSGENLRLTTDATSENDS
jgi:hypothetical protein